MVTNIFIMTKEISAQNKDILANVWISDEYENCNRYKYDNCISYEIHDVPSNTVVHLRFALML